ISHVLLEDDQENKDRLLRALLGHLCPDVWKQVAQGALAQAGQLSRWQSFDKVETGIRDTAKRAGRAAAISALLTQARQSYQQAETQLQAGKYPEVLEPATQARRDLLDAYARCQPARAKEFRAIWCHSAYGVTGMTWDQAIRHLKENGFNAIMPNMLWGGVADYQSKLLPIRDRVAKEGDQIALCVAAGKKYGVAVHVWKVNWNLGNAPREFVERMRAEGRLQYNDKGVEEPWLCPSHPDNFALERDTMLEVARNYDVDGIHFDYIRYPDQAHCYCPGCRKRFEESAGVQVANWPADVLKGGPQYAAYQEFRRANITRLVKAVSEAAHRLKPGIKVSAAVFSNWPECRESVGQDWGEWVRQGYLDFVCPMDYTASNSGYRAMVQVQRDAVAGKIPLVAGVGASAPGLPLDQVIDQIQIARSEGANGFIIFNYAGVVASEYLPALGLGATKGNTPIPYKR
ncbi:MAG TPA: family 10 glycosylhydrolase, partial [Armatimonadota bacterium]|nr:family 10 glycosylhydrolase [Armatimonadota bacterium]